MITQLNPYIPVFTPKGEGYAFALLDYSQEHNVLWGVALNKTGEVWWLPNPEIRLQVNVSLGRVKDNLFDKKSTCE